MACDFYCCLLTQSKDLRTCRSGFPIATTLYFSIGLWSVATVSQFKNENYVRVLSLRFAPV